jgi:uroporphyrin-III C-methyltransferase
VGSSVTFVTGHEEIDKRRPSVNWRALAAASDGLVIYMGLHNLPRIAEELMAGGLPSETPVAVIQQGTVAGQRCLKANLAGVAAECRSQAFKSPSIVVVGDVIDQQVEACMPPPASVTMPIPF